SFDVSRFDSLIVWVNGPDSLAGSELPRIMLEDAQGGLSAASWLSILDDVRVDPEGTGFTEFSESDVVLEVSYIDALPSTSRRPGYPGALSIVFADEPQDTSLAGIGAPAVPAHFIIETESGLRSDFRFRDLDGDGTLSGTNEYIDVLPPESYESSKVAATWRIRSTATSGITNPPGQGDVFRVEVEFDEFSLDADPDSWQRVSLPLDEIKGGDFDAAETVGVVFRH